MKYKNIILTIMIKELKKTIKKLRKFINNGLKLYRKKIKMKWKN